MCYEGNKQEPESEEKWKDIKAVRESQYEKVILKLVIFNTTKD